MSDEFTGNSLNFSTERMSISEGILVEKAAF